MARLAHLVLWSSLAGVVLWGQSARFLPWMILLRLLGRQEAHQVSAYIRYLAPAAGSLSGLLFTLAACMLLGIRLTDKADELVLQRSILVSDTRYIIDNSQGIYVLTYRPLAQDAGLS